MRQVFNKKQLVVMWLTAVILSAFIYRSSVISGVWASRQLLKSSYDMGKWMVYRGPPIYAVNWFRLSLIPVIIGAALIITLAKSQPPKEGRE